MTDELRAQEADEDLIADTERFRRFARRDGEGESEGDVARGRAAGVPFRLLTLAAGILVLLLIVWLLLR
jgi:hypothetical protein